MSNGTRKQIIQGIHRFKGTIWHSTKRKVVGLPGWTEGDTWPMTSNQESKVTAAEMKYRKLQEREGGIAEKQLERFGHK